MLSPSTQVHSQPTRLDKWQRVRDGLFMGAYDGRQMQISVSEEGQLAGVTALYIESTSGRVYELAADGGTLVAQTEPLIDPSLGRPGSRPPFLIAALAFAALGEAAALASGLGLNPFQLLMSLNPFQLDYVSAADVDAEIMLAMNHAVAEMLSEAGDVQDELVLALSSVATMLPPG